MARRKRKSSAADLFEILSTIPWWAGVLLAIASYLVLHPLAVQDIAPNIGTPGATGQLVGNALIKAFATYLQYLLPAVSLAGAAASAFAHRARRRLVRDVAQSRAADALTGMDWQSFEELVGEAFRQQGYSVIVTGGRGPDGGVDLALSRNGEKFLVQCKQWKAFKVGVEIVRELYGVMAACGATGGFVVTSGRFTDPAVEFASGRNIELVDGPKLKAMIDQVQRNPSRPRSIDVGSAPTMSPPDAGLRPDALPRCPKCAKVMVKRVTRRGSNPGLEFWGCSGYPGCRGIRPMVQTPV